MIVNIIDKRSRPYRWKNVTAIVEAAWHDNSVKDSDQVERGPEDDVDYDALEEVSLAEAVAWAQAFKCPVTLYLYDPGDGTSITTTEASVPSV